MASDNKPTDPGQKPAGAKADQEKAEKSANPKQAAVIRTIRESDQSRRLGANKE